jgi:hypothetical protein
MKPPLTHLPDEADIGSGEKSPGHRDTEKMIEQVGNSPARKPPERDKEQGNNGSTGKARDNGQPRDEPG